MRSSPINAQAVSNTATTANCTPNSRTENMANCDAKAGIASVHLSSCKAEPTIRAALERYAVAESAKSAETESM
eukprot:CAMPEP_0172855990 /NCGR_PEP_ID=MMETSP1075-20121228/63362_1 /TAXON_ID=2916 /ORGANISM="Ceratium fusus, Strain PA161109" /LENGTH=73 /DNA_ID=CAMNT_0013703101 /DNA_START=315 /DNA_END=536 /DNA_ORIENTATION=-